MHMPMLSFIFATVLPNPSQTVFLRGLTSLRYGLRISFACSHRTNTRFFTILCSRPLCMAALCRKASVRSTLSGSKVSAGEFRKASRILSRHTYRAGLEYCTARNAEVKRRRYTRMSSCRDGDVIWSDGPRVYTVGRAHASQKRNTVRVVGVTASG